MESTDRGPALGGYRNLIDAGGVRRANIEHGSPGVSRSLRASELRRGDGDRDEDPAASETVSPRTGARLGGSCCHEALGELLPVAEGGV